MTAWSWLRRRRTRPSAPTDDLARLRGYGGPLAEAVAGAIDAVLSGALSPDEAERLARIEALRARLEASDEEIRVTDHGAGSPDLQVTAEQMLDGRIITRRIGEVCRTASKGHPWTLLLFHLVRRFRPTTCLELGTCLGISAAYQAAALELNGRGRLVTLEGAESLALLATRNLVSLDALCVSVTQGRFQDTLHPALLSLDRVNFAFVDGHHEERATEEYFARIAGFCAEPALLVFDDISWSPGMRRAWGRIEKDPRIILSVDLGSVGICGLGGRGVKTDPISLPLARMVQASQAARP